MSPSAVFDHVGFVVSDLEAALAFFVSELGGEIERRGEAGSPDGDDLREWFGIHPRSTAKLAFVRVGGALFELLEWAGPERSTREPGNADAGGRHLALRVADLDATLARLAELPGVVIRAPNPRGFVYVATPFGLELQILGPT